MWASCGAKERQGVRGSEVQISATTSDRVVVRVVERDERPVRPAEDEERHEISQLAVTIPVSAQKSRSLHDEGSADGSHPRRGEDDADRAVGEVRECRVAQVDNYILGIDDERHSAHRTLLVHELPGERVRGVVGLLLLKADGADEQLAIHIVKVLSALGVGLTGFSIHWHYSSFSWRTRYTFMTTDECFTNVKFSSVITLNKISVGTVSLLTVRPKCQEWVYKRARVYEALTREIYITKPLLAEWILYGAGSGNRTRVTTLEG